MSPLYVELVDQLVHGLKYMWICLWMHPLCFPSALVLLAVVRSWVFWLKCWSADQTSKKALADLHFQDEKLFGAILNGINKNLMGRKSTFS